MAVPDTLIHGINRLMHLNLDIKLLIRKYASMLSGPEWQIEVVEGQGRNLDGTHKANLQMIWSYRQPYSDGQTG